jgi:uncharacterized membrane protein (UPF0127 family)
MGDGELARRFVRLPRDQVLGRDVVVAQELRARLLGLALLDRSRAGRGLLIPRCSSVHTFGMRFPLDLFFLDGEGVPTSIHRGVPPNRLLSDRRAVAVLELPARRSEPTA